MAKKRTEVDVETKRVIKLPVRVVPVEEVPVVARKTTFTRTDLPHGDFLMNYYFRRDEHGRLVPEDIRYATHFERVVYDRDGNTIGSMNGELNKKIRW